ncbi:FKBP-type peptidyl-prolyl cis-trans isomerase [Halovenus marina]|uniref:FKBP-type peptidyl-prolyl cis-trans isomerase n=1 Tax=Halovenus marina TaxID=3396621 RepID=UPI003F549A74
MTISEGDTVRIEYVGRLEDGSVFDTSDKVLAETEGLLDDNPDRSFAPFTLEVGEDDVIPGLTEALIGMEDGEQKTVTIPPEKAYGEHTDERIAEYERDTFEEMLGGREATVGTEVETEQGLPGEVTAVEDDTVTVDFNHELAGETLEFDIEVVSVK